MESVYVDLIVSVAQMSQYDIINANIRKYRLSLSIIGLVWNRDKFPFNVIINAVSPTIKNNIPIFRDTILN